jgi:hypothetical protein
MKSKSLSKGFALVWCAISLAACAGLNAQTQGAGGKPPVLALIDASDAQQWNWAKDLGWRIVPAPGDANANADTRIQALAAAARSAAQEGGGAPAPVYLAGRTSSTPAVFYAVSRMPDAWTAAIAIGGSPQSALDTGRVFAINFRNTPILWAGVSAEDETLAGELKAAGANVEWRNAKELTAAAAGQWLGGKTRDEFPSSVDCETSSAAFARCFWMQPTKLDASERNDVLPTTLVAPMTSASLDLGAFRYQRDDPGPGVLVASLPDKYEGPLKAGDRIVQLDGKPIENARRYEETMKSIADSRDAVVMVQRGAARQRVETRVIAPKRPSVVSARVQGKFDAEEREISIVTRAVAELRVTIPAHWIPSMLNWNGLSLEDLKEPGCLTLHVENELLKAAKCQ